MANKKISQLSAISPVPTGALMVLANSGVSRSATVRDIATAIEADASTTFVALTDTPGSITANSFVVGNAAGNALEFGDQTIAKETRRGAGNGYRVFWVGGFPGADTIDWCTVQTLGNCVDWGDLATSGFAAATSGN